ncbi:hypothetical protein EMEDMD4_160022 [Sinorhizobium medicae]|uniref:Uncharacterized protein n=1 Tax=Sinorhizobium medicae TaxID=110321 RepID=A0A508WXR0_9HYPH|nr:hypothetical protein EMEDMD4_160022 [Sinorhizobium medicae]
MPGTGKLRNAIPCLQNRLSRKHANISAILLKKPNVYRLAIDRGKCLAKAGIRSVSARVSICQFFRPCSKQSAIRR